MNHTTIFLAGFWGLFFISAVVLLSIVPGLQYRLMAIYKEPKLKYSGALIAILIGVASIYYHNIWEADIRGVITAFGWISLIKGIVIVASPSALNISEQMVNSKWFGYYLLLVFCTGLYMLLWALRTPLNT